MRRSGIPFPALLVLVFAACGSPEPHTPHSEADVRRAIEAELAKGVEATRTQDIDAYMASVPADLVMHDESGVRIDRRTLRANALRDWSLIPRTLAIEVKVDSLRAFSDTAATVYTAQRWERLMRQRAGEALDTVLTTQSHREHWRRTSRGWYSYEVTELGGELWVNGKPYAP